MTLAELASSASELGDLLGKSSSLEALLVKWIDRQLTAKSTKLDDLRVLARTDGGKSLAAMLALLPDTSLRKLAKNIDVHNKELPTLGPSQLKGHVLALVTRTVDPALKSTKASGPKSSATPKKAKSAARPRDILVDSKY